MKRYIFNILMLCCGLCVGAQEPADSTAMVAEPTIADRIEASGIATINQPPRLNQRLVRTAPAEAPAEKDGNVTVGGYRIQMFSGNNARTAKADADRRARAVSDGFPEYATYVTYDAPYWRLKVGDFRSYEDAAAALSVLKKAFPDFAREMRLVRDRIHVEE